ncbi:MAG: hypothetical protein AAGE52_09405 [Myxococcota bacterium]
MRRKAFYLSLTAMVWGCGDDASPTDAGVDTAIADAGTDVAEDVPGDAGVDAFDAGFDAGPPCDGPPGLYIDPDCEELSPEILPYNPQFWLWSDGTDKGRFIAFPDGAVIDSRDEDAWVFPVGTRIWKNFDLDGMHLETRYFEKTRAGEGLSTWRIRTYQWNEDQNAVTEVTDGAFNVLGTDHDIPPVAACGRCHDGGAQPDIVLGFGSIQLNHDDSDVTLADLESMGLLSDPVDEALAVIPTPDPVVREALGYLHANCGHCHGGFAPAAGMRLFLETGTATIEETGAYQTAVGQPSAWVTPEATTRVVPGDPEASTLFLRMNTREPVNQMPPLATEAVDDVGLEEVRQWILSLPTDGG